MCQIDVRRAAGVKCGWSDPVLWERTLARAWPEEPWLFEPRIKTRSGGGVKNGVAEEVVPLGTITSKMLGLLNCQLLKVCSFRFFLFARYAYILEPMLCGSSGKLVRSW